MEFEEGGAMKNQELLEGQMGQQGCSERTLTPEGMGAEGRGGEGRGGPQRPIPPRSLPVTHVQRGLCMQALNLILSIF